MKTVTISRYALGAALAAALLASAAPSLAATKYTCNRYVKNKPTGGHVSIVANNKRDAEKAALEKYRKELKKKVDSVRCKGAWF